MFKISDFNILKDIFKKELLAIRGAYFQYSTNALCTHYLEDKILYPVRIEKDSTIYYRSDIPIYVKSSRFVRDYLYETIEIKDGTNNAFMTFHEYLFHTWIFFEKAVFKNLIFCIKNYDLNKAQREACEEISGIDESHYFYQKLRKLSLDVFVDILSEMLNQNFEDTMLNSYVEYHKKSLNLRMVLRYRRLPFSYQKFIFSLFNETPSFIAFKSINNEAIITYNQGDDVFDYVQDCMRHLKRLQREGGVVVATDRSSLSFGKNTPVRLYSSDIYRARQDGLHFVNKKTEAYKSSKNASGNVTSSLLPKSRKA